MRARKNSVFEFVRVDRILRWGVVAIALASPLALSGCYFLAGAAAGAGVYAATDDDGHDGGDDDE
ncbi:MAG: hypothetical protein ACF8QF_10200 [Phycisphaerales bacterium]